MGLPERTFIMRVGVITSGQKPALTLRIMKLEEHKEQMAQELVMLIRDGIAGRAPNPDAGPTVLIGTYTKSA